MIPVTIGVSSGLLVIVIIALLKRLDKKIIYGLILSGIGFLYVGFAWSDTGALIINGAQAIFYLFMAAFGIKRGLYLLAAGFFLHGIWDGVYHLFADSNL